MSNTGSCLQKVLMPSKKKSRALEDVHAKFGERDGDIERTLREKEEELEIYKQGMDDTLLELEQLKMVGILGPFSPCQC